MALMMRWRLMLLTPLVALMALALRARCGRAQRRASAGPTTNTWKQHPTWEGAHPQVHTCLRAVRIDPSIAHVRRRAAGTRARPRLVS